MSGGFLLVQLRFPVALGQQLLDGRPSAARSPGDNSLGLIQRPLPGLQVQPGSRHSHDHGATGL
jgi:hypothetical protein